MCEILRQQARVQQLLVQCERAASRQTRSNQEPGIPPRLQLAKDKEVAEAHKTMKTQTFLVARGWGTMGALASACSATPGAGGVDRFWEEIGEPVLADRNSL